MKVNQRGQVKAFRVRNFGNDREYDSIEDLIAGIDEHYRGQSIAIHVKGGRHGMVAPFFVDVTQSGRLLATYSDHGEEVVDVSRLRAYADGLPLDRATACVRA